jgi:hypothetical protein
MRSCLALFVFLFVFLPLAFCGLLTASVSSWLLDRNFYTDLFSAEEIYSALLSGNLDLENSLELGSTELDPATTRAFGQAILEAVSPSYVRDEVLRNINAVFDYLEDTSRGLTLTWDLRPLKRGLSAEQIDTFADVLIKNLPPCSPRTPQADLILPTCLPRDKSAEQLTAEVRQNLPRFVEQLPDFQTIGEPIPPNTQSGALLGGLAQTAVSSGALSLLTGNVLRLAVHRRAGSALYKRTLDDARYHVARPSAARVAARYLAADRHCRWHFLRQSQHSLR